MTRMGILIIIVGLLGVGAYGIFEQRLNAQGPLATATTVSVQRGASLSEIARNLERKGVIPQRLDVHLGGQDGRGRRVAEAWRL